MNTIGYQIRQYVQDLDSCERMQHVVALLNQNDKQITDPDAHEDIKLMIEGLLIETYRYYAYKFLS